MQPTGDTPRRRIIAGMSEIETLPARDGTLLLTRRWDPPGNREPWATVLLVHGLGEHSGRWESVGERLAAAGLAVRSFDLRGHGASSGRRAHVERFDEHLEDVEDRLAAVLVDWQGGDSGPVVLYGHSLGGLIAADYLLSARRPPAAAVLSAPALGDRVRPALRKATPLLSRAVPRLELANPFSPDDLSRDPGVAAAYRADPLVSHRTTARLGAEIFAAADRVNGAVAAGQTLPCPTLVIHGTADPIVPPASTAALGRLPGVERQLLPDVRHEPYNDPDGRAIVDAVVAWLRGQLAGPDRPD